MLLLLSLFIYGEKIKEYFNNYGRNDNQVELISF